MTPEQCRQMAASLSDLLPEQRLTAEELEIIQEEVFQEPMRYGSPQAGFEAMQRRLALFASHKAQVLNTLDDCTESLRPELLRQLDQLNRSIADTQQRRDGYQFQLQHEN
jgi:hypothetical protein